MIAEVKSWVLLYLHHHVLVLQPIASHALNVTVSYVILSVKVTRAGERSVTFH